MLEVYFILKLQICALYVKVNDGPMYPIYLGTSDGLQHHRLDPVLLHQHPHHPQQLLPLHIALVINLFLGPRPDGGHQFLLLLQHLRQVTLTDVDIPGHSRHVQRDPLPLPPRHNFLSKDLGEHPAHEVADEDAAEVVKDKPVDDGHHVHVVSQPPGEEGGDGDTVEGVPQAQARPVERVVPRPEVVGEAPGLPQLDHCQGQQVEGVEYLRDEGDIPANDDVDGNTRMTEIMTYLKQQSMEGLEMRMGVRQILTRQMRLETT